MYPRAPTAYSHSHLSISVQISVTIYICANIDAKEFIKGGWDTHLLIGWYHRINRQSVLCSKSTLTAIEYLEDEEAADKEQRRGRSRYEEGRRERMARRLRTRVAFSERRWTEGAVGMVSL